MGRLLSLSGAAVDALTLRALEGAFVSGDRPDLEHLPQRLAQALAVYGDPDLLHEPQRFFRPPAWPERFDTRLLDRLRGGARLELTWRSTYRTHDPGYQAEYDALTPNERNVVHLWRHDRPAAVTAICLHPWCGGHLRLTEVMFAARTLYRLGLDVALFTLPLHGQRTPHTARFSGQLFPSRNIHRTNEAFGQAIADLRVLLRWLREQGAGAVGALGISLGGYTAALLAGLEPSLAFAVPIVAPAAFADVLWHHGARSRHRRDVEQRGLTLEHLRRLMAVHSPLLHPLRLPRERTLVVWGAGDRIVPSSHSLALWEHWERPAIHGYPGGHMLHFGRLGRAGYLRAITEFLSDPRLGPPRASA